MTHGHMFVAGSAKVLDDNVLYAVTEDRLRVFRARLARSLKRLQFVQIPVAPCETRFPSSSLLPFLFWGRVPLVKKTTEKRYPYSNLYWRT